MPNLDAIRKKMMKEKCTVPRFHTLSNGVICTTARPTGGRFRIYFPVHQPTERDGTREKAEAQDKTTGTLTHSGTDGTYRARRKGTTRAGKLEESETLRLAGSYTPYPRDDGTIHTIIKIKPKLKKLPSGHEGPGKHST